MRAHRSTSSCPETYQAGTLSKSLREGIDYIDGRIEPFCQPIIAGSKPKPIQFLYLLLEYDENGARRLAGLELGREWMGKEIVFGLLFVDFQGVIEDKLEVW